MEPFHHANVRQHSLYSLVHESRQGFFSHVGGKKNNKKNFTSQIFFLVGHFLHIFLIFFFTQVGSIKNSTLFDMLEEKIKKHSNVSFFSYLAHF